MPAGNKVTSRYKTGLATASVDVVIQAHVGIDETADSFLVELIERVKASPRRKGDAAALLRNGVRDAGVRPHEDTRPSGPARYSFNDASDSCVTSSSQPSGQSYWMLTCPSSRLWICTSSGT